MNELRTEADRALCIDHDVLLLAKPGLDPAAAVADLKSRFPAAFRKRVHEMTAPELADLERRLLNPKPRVATAEEIGDCRNMTAEQFTRAQMKLGIRVSGTDAFRAHGGKV